MWIVRFWKDWELARIECSFMVVMGGKCVFGRVGGVKMMFYCEVYPSLFGLSSSKNVRMDEVCRR